MMNRDLESNLMIQMLSANIRLLRRKMGLNQTDFAKLIGIKQNSMSKLERGHYAPTLHNIYRIARRLKVSPDNLFGRKVSNPLPSSYEAFRRRFSRNLKKARMERDLTQMEMADRVGTKQPTYNRVERGTIIRDNPSRLASPDLETIRIYAAALKVDPLSLFLD